MHMRATLSQYQTWYQNRGHYCAVVSYRLRLRNVPHYWHAVSTSRVLSRVTPNARQCTHVCHTRRCGRPNFRSLSGAGVPIAIPTIGSHQLFSPSEVRIISRGTPHKWTQTGARCYAGEAPFGVAPRDRESLKFRTCLGCRGTRVSSRPLFFNGFPVALSIPFRHTYTHIPWKHSETWVQLWLMNDTVKPATSLPTTFYCR